MTTPSWGTLTRRPETRATPLKRVREGDWVPGEGGKRRAGEGPQETEGYHSLQPGAFLTTPPPPPPRRSPHAVSKQATSGIYVETRSKEVVKTLGLQAPPSFAIARMHPVLGLLTVNAEGNPHFAGESPVLRVLPLLPPPALASRAPAPRPRR